MHKKKYNSLTKNFIQGLRPLSSTLPSEIKKILKKNGFNLSSIVDNWTKIVGNEISNKCYPINIKTQANSKDINLILNVLHGKEIDIEYNKKNIIDKINTYFGYGAVGRIQIVQGPVPEQQPPDKGPAPIPEGARRKLDQRLAFVSDPDLKAALSALGSQLLKN